MLITNIGRLVTMIPGSDREGSLGVIPKAAVYIEGDRIGWCGPEGALPRAAAQSVATALDAGGHVVMPGLIDCHTHLVHAGTRVEEFVQRARGATYLEIARQGGGIMTTVRATRAASEDELFQGAVARAGEMIARGVTTIEIKSGYGLELETELKILRVVSRLRKEFPIRFHATFLGAHVVPEEFRERRGAYVRLIQEEMLPAVVCAKLAECCDVFVEEGAFTASEAEAICGTARGLGLRIRLHVDQFSDVHGGELAVRVGASSADHLDALSDAGIAAMARAGVVAGILPGASFFARAASKPPIAKLVAAGVPMAIATDYNPGTSPTLDLWLCATLAVVHLGLDPDLALRGITCEAARALGCAAEVGSVAVGRRADLLMTRYASEYAPLYHTGSMPTHTVIAGGEVVWPQ